jgi:hypothetical protein
MADKKIPGIHNYCDRWCERCSFTSRCNVFENETSAPPGANDMSNKSFWDRLSLNFSKASVLLEQAAQRSGIDLNALATNVEEQQHKQKQIREESENHPLIQWSDHYSELTHAWLKSQPGMLDKLEELRDSLTLGTASSAEAKTQIALIKDCLAVVQWYETFIHVKLMRAVMGKMDDDGWEEENGFPRDFDGSAKIAIISMERSMQAWLKLFEFLPEQEDDFFKVLGLLEKMKTRAVEEFPKAMDFRRPGFDD